MKETYGPEDIEQLLLDKEFSDLLAEEKSYVLKHMEDEFEYARMREMLLGYSQLDDGIVPPIDMRSKLIADHESQHAKPPFKIWLNSLFNWLILPDDWMRPALQLAGVTLLLLGSIFLFRQLKDDLGQEILVQEVERPLEQNEAEARTPIDPSPNTESTREDNSLEEQVSIPLDEFTSQLSENSEPEEISSEENSRSTSSETPMLDLDETDQHNEADELEHSPIDEEEEFFSNNGLQKLEDESQLDIAVSNVDRTASDDVIPASTYSADAIETARTAEASKWTEFSIHKPVGTELITALYTAW